MVRGRLFLINNKRIREPHQKKTRNWREKNCAHPRPIDRRTIFFTPFPRLVASYGATIKRTPSFNASSSMSSVMLSVIKTGLGVGASDMSRLYNITYPST